MSLCQFRYALLTSSHIHSLSADYNSTLLWLSMPFVHSLATLDVQNTVIVSPSATMLPAKTPTVWPAQKHKWVTYTGLLKAYCSLSFPPFWILAWKICKWYCWGWRKQWWWQGQWIPYVSREVCNLLSILLILQQRQVNSQEACEESRNLWYTWQNITFSSSAAVPFPPPASDISSLLPLSFLFPPLSLSLPPMPLSLPVLYI